MAKKCIKIKRDTVNDKNKIGKDNTNKGKILPVDCSTLVNQSLNQIHNIP